MAGSIRINRTGDKYGSATVVGPDSLSSDWIIHWGCCGRVVPMDMEQVRSLARKHPQRCILCVTGKDTGPERSAAYLAKLAAAKARRAAAKDAERKASLAIRDAINLAQDACADQAGVHIPGRGFWPVLTGPFGRLYQNGHESLSRHAARAPK